MTALQASRIREALGLGRDYIGRHADHRRTDQGVTMSDSSTQGITIVLHPVTDLKAATAVYTALLGTPPAHEADYYVGYDVGGQHIGLVPGGAGGGIRSTEDP